MYVQDQLDIICLPCAVSIPGPTCMIMMKAATVTLAVTMIQQTMSVYHYNLFCALVCYTLKCSRARCGVTGNGVCFLPPCMWWHMKGHCGHPIQKLAIHLIISDKPVRIKLNMYWQLLPLNLLHHLCWPPCPNMEQVATLRPCLTFTVVIVGSSTYNTFVVSVEPYFIFSLHSGDSTFIHVSFCMHYLLSLCPLVCPRLVPRIIHKNECKICTM